jgi:hypothetical protein
MTNKTTQSTEIEQTEVLELTKLEKKILSHRIKTRIDEREALLSRMTLISEKAILWYIDPYTTKRETAQMTVSVYAFKSGRYKENYLNSEAFYVVTEFDGRIWRCKDFKEINFLVKALKKQYVLKYPAFEWKP